MEEEPRRVVLLGKTGTGKSSFGNTLIGEKKFQVNSSASSGTSECKAATKSNAEITVVDTPGFFDTREDDAEMKNKIIRCITECSPGPHAFLILLKVEKYTEHENQVVEKIKEYFSEDVFKHAVLVFTHGDQLDEDVSIKDFVSGNKALKELSDKCGGRCHVVDNKYWKNNQQDPERNNQFQMRELMKTIEEMVRQNGGGCYTNEMLQEVERKIKEEEKRTGSRAEAMRIVSTKLKNSASTADDWLRFLLGKKLWTAIGVVATGAGTGAVVGGVAAAVVGGAVGAVVGGAVGVVAAAAVVGGIPGPGSGGAPGPAITKAVSRCSVGYQALEDSAEEEEAKTTNTKGKSSSRMKKTQ